MKKEDSVYLKHILDAVNDIDEFVKGMNKETFLSNKAIEYAVVRSIEIIGESSKHLSKKFREQHKDIPLNGPTTPSTIPFSVTGI